MICPSHKPRTRKIIFRFLSQDIVRCISDCGLCACVWTLCMLPHIIILGDYLLQRFSPVPFQYVATLDQILIFVRLCLCVSGKSLCMLLVHTHGMHARQTRSQKRNKMGKIDFIYGLIVRMCVQTRHRIYRRRGYVYEICWYRFRTHIHMAWIHVSSILISKLDFSIKCAVLVHIPRVVSISCSKFFLVLCIFFVVRINLIY